MAAGKVVRRLKGHNKKIELIDTWGDFAVSAEDRGMMVWDAGALRGGASRFGRTAIHAIGAYEDEYSGSGMFVAVGTGGRTALTARRGDGSWMLWDLESGQVQSRIPDTRELMVTRVVAAREGDFYVIGTHERRVGRSDTYGSGRLYFVDGGRVTRSIEIGALFSLAVSADGMTAFTGASDGTVSVWAPDLVASGSVPDGIPALSAVNISAVSGTVFGSDDEGGLVKINPVSGLIERVGKAAGRVVDMAVSDNESTVLSVLEEGQVEVRVDGTKQRTISVPGVRIQTVEITPDRREAVGTGKWSPRKDTIINDAGRWRWDVSTGDVIDHSDDTSRCLVLARRTGLVACVQGFGVISGLRSVFLRIDPELAAFYSVQALAVDGIGERIALATRYYRVQVWDTITMEQVAELALSDIKTGEHEHNGGAMSLWLSFDGRWCLAATSDRTVILWEVGAERPVAVYTMDEAPDWVGANEDGSIIVVKDKSGGLYTFKIEGVSMDVEVRV